MNETRFAQARAAVALHSDMFRPDFYDWLNDNYPVFEYFEQSALKVHESGFKHYSARTIVEMMRHRTNIREIGDGTWKLNDHRTPDMARLFSLLHPECAGLFEFRTRVAPADGEGGMSDKRTFRLVHDIARRLAAAQCHTAPDGYIAEFKPATKSRIQEEKYHAMIGDIAEQCTFMGQKWHKDDWKRLLVDAFAKAMRELGTPLHHDGRVVPSLDGERVVQLGIQTKEFRVKEAANFIEYLYAYGSENGVVWSDAAQYGLTTNV